MCAYELFSYCFKIFHNCRSFKESDIQKESECHRSYYKYNLQVGGNKR